MSSPTQRSLAELRKRGMTVAVVERWNQYAKVRQDLFGFIDLVAMSPTLGIIGVQACAGASHSARKAKILAEPKAAIFLASGGKIWLHSWAKRGGRGKRKVWTLREEKIEAVNPTHT